MDRHKQLRTVLSKFPESKSPLCLLGTIAKSYGLSIHYGNKGRSILVTDRTAKKEKGQIDEF